MTSRSSLEHSQFPGLWHEILKISLKTHDFEKSGIIAVFFLLHVQGYDNKRSCFWCTNGHIFSATSPYELV